MQSQNPFFDDLSKVTTGAMGTLAGMGREFEVMMRERLREFIGGMDMVTREEFEAVKTLAVHARAEVDMLKAQVAAMQARQGSASATADAPAPARDQAPAHAPTAEQAEGGAGVDGQPTA